MRSFRQDARHSLRLIKLRPWFAAVTVLTLALGIGANTAIFSILDALVLRNLPVWRPDRLVQITAKYRNSPTVPFSFPVFQLLQENQRVFSSLFAWTPGGRHNIEMDGALFPGDVRAVSGNFYEALGATPILGRLIGPEDTAHIPGMPVAVISYEFWEQRFGRDPAVIGKTIHIEGVPFTIIGVTRKWFMGMTPGRSPQITVPLTSGTFAPLATTRSLLWISAGGRLKGGLTIDQAGAQLRSIWPQLLVATAPTASPGPRLQSWLNMRLEMKPAATGVNADVLRSDERTLTGGAGRLGKGLVVTQVALSLVLVFGAGLLLRTFQSLRSFDPAFQRNGVLEVNLNRRPGGFDHVDINSYRKQLVDAVAGFPGVISASFADIDIPAGDSGWSDIVSSATVDSPADATRTATLVTVSPGFFQTLGIPILSGRTFDWTDDDKHPRVAIVAENLARRLSRSGDVLGTRVRFGVQPDLQSLEIIGVARTARLINVRNPDALIIYVPSPQHPDRSDAGNLFVRSQNPGAIVRLVEHEVQSYGHEYSITARTLEDTSDLALAEDRMTALLSSLFAGLALLLAGIGLFGLMSYAVARRTREIGIRMAVGAQQGAILGLILRESVALCGLGIVVGIPCAIAGTRLVTHMLFGVGPADPLTFAIAGAMLLAVGAAAGYWPARRAAKIDPMEALRCE